MILNDKSKPHNLKVVGSNPTPATKNKSIKSVSYKAPDLLVGGFLLGFFTLTYPDIWALGKGFCNFYFY